VEALYAALRPGCCSLPVDLPSSIRTTLFRRRSQFGRRWIEFRRPFKWVFKFCQFPRKLFGRIQFGRRPSSSRSPGGSSLQGSNAGSTTSRSSVQSSRSGGVNAVRQPNNTRAQNHKAEEPGKSPQTEHRKFFAFLRHPFGKHAPKTAEADLAGRACPTGQSVGKNGKCVGNGTNDNTSNLCVPGAAGSACSATKDTCASIRGQEATASAELRSINAEMRTVCSGNPSGEECSSAGQRHEGAVARYRALQGGAPANCRGTFVDPLSL